MAIAMFVSSAVYSQIVGNLILDNPEIPPCAPISGVIEMRLQQDTEIPGTNWYAFDFVRSSYTIFITTPDDSTVVLDWPHLADGLHVDYGPLTGATTLYKDEIYAFPVFVLRTSRGFMFASPGNYKITYRFDVLPGRPEFSASVRVTESDSRDRPAFMSVFSKDAIIIEPFCADPLHLPLPQLDPSSPYFEHLQIAEANMQSSSLLVSRLLHGEPSELNSQAIGSWLINEMNTQKVARGVALDSAHLIHTASIFLPEAA